ncbi:MAG: DNA/RNA non-specific endonuclease [Bacteroidales bacterium]|nr:DNA/RNA non-specific endonuclease [Bacteroidales bacterium]
MRKFTKLFALCAAFSVVMASCSKHELEDLPDPVENQDKPLVRQNYTFDLAEDLTRATLGNNGVFWEPGDMIGIYLDAQGLGNDEAEINTETSPKTVTLRSANSIPAGTLAYAYYPFNENNTSLSSATFTIPRYQTGGEISAMPMVGVPFTVEDGGTTSTNGQIFFMNLASIIDFQVYSSTYAGETIQQITFQSYGNTISGDATLNLSAINPNDEGTLAFSSWSSGYDFVTVRQNATVASTKNDAESVYMVLAPGTYDSGTITIETNLATYTFPFSNKSLARNELKHYTMNLNNATRQVVSEVSTFPYTEAFTSSRGSFVIEGGTGNEWNFVTTYGAKVSGRYSNSNHDVTTALVSPWINLNGLEGATLAFQHAYNGYLNTASDAALYIMSEGDETWSQIDIAFADAPASQSAYSSFKTVSQDISAYLGHRIRIKFEYKSTTSNAGIWEIRNFEVTAYVPTPVYGLYSGDLSEGDYVIYYSGKALKNTVTSNRLDYTEVSPANNQIEDPDASIVWHIARSGNYWTIYNADVKKYLASNGTKNQGQLLDSGTDDNSLWSVSGSSTYDFTNKYNSEKGVNATLRNNGTYGFACYSNSTQSPTGGPLTLYKLGYSASSGSGGSGGGGTGGGSTPSSDLPGHLGCFEIPGLSNVSFSGSGDEVLPATNPTLWYRYDTGNSNQKIVTHTFKNTTVSPNRVMRSYTLLQDYDKKCALWVACSFNNDVYPQAVSRSEKWCYDPALPTDWQPNLTKSYPDKGGYSYDRGHQLAASYRETTSDQVKMTCYFTNMTPQLSGLNQGRWQSTVEKNVRDLGTATTGRDTLYVVSGPLFQSGYGTVEDKDGMACARPTHYFQCFMKVSFNANGEPTSAKGAAYLVEHVSSPTVQYVTIDLVEALTDDGQGNHFDFFANVPAGIQNPAESTATALASF